MLSGVAYLAVAGQAHAFGLCKLGEDFGRLGAAALGGAGNTPALPAMPKFAAAVSRVQGGTGRGLILALGDSTVAGAGAGSGGTSDMNGAYSNGWPSQFATLLNGSIPTVFQSFFGSQVSQVAYGTYDTRLVLGANWTAAGVSILGGVTFKFAVGAVNNLAFTPPAAFDTIIVYYARNPGLGTFTVNIDGGTALGTAINTNAASALSSVTYTVAKGTHTINIVPGNDQTLHIAGIRTYDSTVPAIDIIQVGAYGALTATFDVTTSPWSAINALKTLAPDLTFIDLTINDSNAPTLLSTYSTQLNDITVAAKVSGDGVLIVGPPSNTVLATNGTLDTFIAALKSIAAANNCRVVDTKDRWGSYAAVQPTYPYFDNFHPETAGYGDMAAAIRASLTGVV